MINYKIEIINSIENNKYYGLEKLIKDFAIHVYMLQKLNLYKYPNLKKLEVIRNYEKILSSEDKKELKKDILSRIEFAKNSILNNNKDKVTRYYILLENEKVIGFQTAQIRKNKDTFEGWRNFAYIKQEYAGKSGAVVDTYNKRKNGVLTNVIYENITNWFKENGVSKEKTATGKNMYKNILVYIVFKGFIPEKEDEQRVYLVKDYSKVTSKKELKKIYKDYMCKMDGFHE